MDSRRAFLKKAALFTGAAGIDQTFAASVVKAMGIHAEPGSTYLDAEHIVFLMQENRSFDHMLGTLKGVRGFNDPHPHVQPGKQKVWLQKDGKGFTYAPFHVDIRKTKITWQGGLPHSWKDQVAARNNGHYDQWVPIKSAMSLAYYKRNDIPFYYNLADAFTVCDQHFCSSLTGTTPNRLFFFTGTIRGEKSKNATAVVNNDQAESQNNVFVDWSTFPELMEDHGVDWRVYQNELWTSRLPEGEIDDWLGNYGDNPLEYISRHRVKLSAYFRKNGDHTVNPPLSAAEVQRRYDALTQREKNLIDKAFTTNISEPDYLELEPFTFKNDLGKEETIQLPKGDIFHQFRKDVDSGQLPTVSWLVAPQRFSDHTSSPLYGTWYVSEALDILTKNPEVWKKTIFILTYDENDGYFDHQPPFVVPDPKDPFSGKVSSGIDFSTDFEPKKGSPIGLGYRVPLIVASPWSKGGFVNSQVFDHTSSLMFLEHFLSLKTNRNIRSNNISDWRRMVCGDLTSVFRPYNGDEISSPKPLKRTEVITNIGNAKNKPAQPGPVALSETDILKINTSDAFSADNSVHMPKQERGTKPACALPYALSVNAEPDAGRLLINFAAGKTSFGAFMVASGAPFTMYTPVAYKEKKGKSWAYAVSPGDSLTESLEPAHFENGIYDLAITGPNGFYRHFRGTASENISITVEAEQTGLLVKKYSGKLVIKLVNYNQQPVDLLLSDKGYGSPEEYIHLPPKQTQTLIKDVQKNGNWYDISIRYPAEEHFEYRYAGKIESGAITTTDPYMGNI